MRIGNEKMAEILGQKTGPILERGLRCARSDDVFISQERESSAFTRKYIMQMAHAHQLANAHTRSGAHMHLH
jgi:hypothetical protein